MKICKSLLPVAGFVLTFLIAATAANAPTLSFKYTNVKVPGALTTAVGGINNAGVVVGQYQAGKGVTRGFMMAGGKFDPHRSPEGFRHHLQKHQFRRRNRGKLRGRERHHARVPL